MLFALKFTVCKVLSLALTYFWTLVSHSHASLSPFNPQNQLGFHLSHFAQKFVSYCWYKPVMPNLVLQHLGKFLLMLFPLFEIFFLLPLLFLSKSYLSSKVNSNLTFPSKSSRSTPSHSVLVFLRRPELLLLFT